MTEGGAANLQSVSDRRTSRIVKAVLLMIAFLIVAWFSFPYWRNRESMRARKQREWILATAQPLEKIGPPQLSAHTNFDRLWITDAHLVFSNGWAAYRINTIHDDETVADVALLRLSDGSYYASKLHYCVGIQDWMRRPANGAGQPLDAKQFFDTYGSPQQWNLISPDGKIWCTTISPNADRPRKSKKTVWLSISTLNSSGATNLFSQKYSFSGVHLGWHTRWPSVNNLEIDFYNYLRLIGTSPSNYLGTVKIERDKETGRFREGKNLATTAK